MGALASAMLSECHVGHQEDSYEELGARSQRCELMMEELFKLHDLDASGTLEEVELVKLNEKIAILHHGVAADPAYVRERYRTIFRAELDPEGRGVPYSRFRSYMFRMLDHLDPDEPTQAMIMDHFIAEANLALSAFPGSLRLRPGSLSALNSVKQQAQPMKQQMPPPLSPSPRKAARQAGKSGVCVCCGKKPCAAEASHNVPRFHATPQKGFAARGVVGRVYGGG